MHVVIENVHNFVLFVITLVVVYNSLSMLLYPLYIGNNLRNHFRPLFFKHITMLHLDKECIANLHM